MSKCAIVVEHEKMNSREQIGLWFLLLRISLLLYLCETHVVSRSDADHNIIRLISLFDPSVTFFKAQKARWSKKDLLFRDNSEVLSRKRTYEHRLEGTGMASTNTLNLHHGGLLGKLFIKFINFVL